MKTLHSAFAIIALSLVPAAGCTVGEQSIGGNEEGIIGGTVDDGDPSVVSIFAHAPGATTGSLCTGSVISPTSILTAAHCVDPRIVGGGNVFEVYTGTYFGQSAPLAVAATVQDPAFNPSDLAAGHDIAIIKLAQPTDLAPLPYGGVSDDPNVRIVGFGMNTHVSNPWVPSGSGTKRTEDTTINGASATLLNIGDTDHQTCHGDSGGPAFQGGVIVGVTSFGSDLQGGVVCVFGGTDTRVDAYLPFIEANKW